MADLRENVVEFYADDKRATGTFTQGRYVSKIKKLAEKYPDGCPVRGYRIGQTEKSIQIITKPKVYKY